MTKAIDDFVFFHRLRENIVLLPLILYCMHLWSENEKSQVFKPGLPPLCLGCLPPQECRVEIVVAGILVIWHLFQLRTFGHKCGTKDRNQCTQNRPHLDHHYLGAPSWEFIGRRWRRRCRWCYVAALGAHLVETISYFCKLKFCSHSPRPSCQFEAFSVVVEALLKSKRKELAK